MSKSRTRELTEWVFRATEVFKWQRSDFPESQVWTSLCAGVARDGSSERSHTLPKVASIGHLALEEAKHDLGSGSLGIWGERSTQTLLRGGLVGTGLPRVSGI